MKAVNVKKICAGMAGALLVFALIVAGCGGTGPDTTPGSGTLDLGIGAPRITAHPTSADYASGAAIAPLTVTAEVTRGEPNLSYRWYSVTGFSNTGGTVIDGADANTYQPTGEGIFYAEVTNTVDGQTKTGVSNPARIRVGASVPVPAATITISGQQRQYIRGFGAMSNAFGISGAEGEEVHYVEIKDIDTMFNPENPEGLGLKVLRIHIFPYSIDDVIAGNAEQGMGSANRDYLTFVKWVNVYGGYVAAAPWTPPYPEWKTNNSLNGGGHLMPQFYRPYANYLKNWAQEMSDKGAPIYSISIQNEPSFTATYYGMEWTPEEHRDWLKEQGAVITAANNGDGVPGFGGGTEGRVKLMTGEPHNDITWNDAALNDPQARAQADIVAHHTYGSWNTRYANALDNEPRLETWMMEKNVNSASLGNQLTDSTWDKIWQVMHEVHHVIAHNDSSVYTWWYGKRFYSFIGDGTYGTQNNAVLPRGHGIAHFARYLTDTVRLETSASGFTAQVINLHGQAQADPGINGIRAVAGMRRSSPANAKESELLIREDMVSLVVMDSRSSGDETDIRVALPDGFTATSVSGIISGPGQMRKPVPVTLANSGKDGIVTLPANSMISLEFKGSWN
jgi:O-glycosyl hydrolase